MERSFGPFLGSGDSLFSVVNHLNCWIIVWWRFCLASTWTCRVLLGVLETLHQGKFSGSIDIGPRKLLWQVGFWWSSLGKRTETRVLDGNLSREVVHSLDEHSCRSQLLLRRPRILIVVIEDPVDCYVESSSSSRFRILLCLVSCKLGRIRSN